MFSWIKMENCQQILLFPLRQLVTGHFYSCSEKKFQNPRFSIPEKTQKVEIVTEGYIIYFEKNGI